MVPGSWQHEPCTEVIRLRIGPELKYRFETLCQENGLVMSHFLRQLIAEEVELYERMLGDDPEEKE